MHHYKSTMEKNLSIWKKNSRRLGVLVSWNLDIFHVNSKETESWGATEIKVWIGNFNVKVWKTTEHKVHKIWHSLKFCKISGKWTHPWGVLVLLKFYWAPDIVKFVLGRFSHFNIAIAESNSTFCGA